MSETVGATLGRQRREREEKQNQQSQFFGTNDEIEQAKELARQRKNAYQREQYAKNKEKYKGYQQKHWEKKARSFFDEE